MPFSMRSAESVTPLLMMILLLSPAGPARWCIHQDTRISRHLLRYHV